MKILFDQGTPVPLRGHLREHTVVTAYEQGWANLLNGQLLNVAQQAGYDLLITRVYLDLSHNFPGSDTNTKVV